MAKKLSDLARALEASGIRSYPAKEEGEYTTDEIATEIGLGRRAAGERMEELVKRGLWTKRKVLVDGRLLNAWRPADG